MLWPSTHFRGKFPPVYMCQTNAEACPSSSVERRTDHPRQVKPHRRLREIVAQLQQQQLPPLPLGEAAGLHGARRRTVQPAWVGAGPELRRHGRTREGR